MGTLKDTTAEIVKELKQGRDWEENWRRLFNTYSKPIGRFFQKKGLSRKDGEDLTQEVFFYVYKKLEGIRTEDRFESWLFTIAKNVYVNKMRETMAERRNPNRMSSEGALPQAVFPRADPEETILEKEKWERLHTALRELPRQMRRCVQLRVEACPHQEIAAIMRISTNTVKAHLYQAKRILREKLSPYFSDEVESLDSEDR